MVSGHAYMYVAACVNVSLFYTISFLCLYRVAGQLAFREFLRTEYSEENILFWLACEEYKTITTSNEIAIAAKRIYAEFVHVDAPRQINIDCGTRQEITNSMSQPTLSCFDKAQRLIYKLMKKDCYPRFLKSEIYQGLLEPSEAR
uniref:Regulator of G-protein signaling 1 n=1 Tax=Oncorhynchus kisutch TaxID=8019 RepID=A0A8C7KXU2_ONCKI